MSARKLWGSKFPFVPGDPMSRHESKPGAYRAVQRYASQWQAGALRSQHVNVYVDERQGRGWELYERIDLDTFGADS